MSVRSQESNSQNSSVKEVLSFRNSSPHRAAVVAINVSLLTKENMSGSECHSSPISSLLMSILSWKFRTNCLDSSANPAPVSQAVYP